MHCLNRCPIVSSFLHVVPQKRKHPQACSDHGKRKAEGSYRQKPSFHRLQAFTPSNLCGVPLFFFFLLQRLSTPSMLNEPDLITQKLQNPLIKEYALNHTRVPITNLRDIP